MAHHLPPFEPVTLLELRGLWPQFENKDIRRLILEVQRYRLVIADIDRLYLTIHQAWRDQVGGDLVALHLLKQVMYSERYRLPSDA